MGNTISDNKKINNSNNHLNCTKKDCERCNKMTKEKHDNFLKNMNISDEENNGKIIKKWSDKYSVYKSIDIKIMLIHYYKLLKTIIGWEKVYSEDKKYLIPTLSDDVKFDSTGCVLSLMYSLPCFYMMNDIVKNINQYSEYSVENIKKKFNLDGYIIDDFRTLNDHLIFYLINNFDTINKEYKMINYYNIVKKNRNKIKRGYTEIKKCMVCSQSMDIRSLSSECTILGCGHYYHKDCLKKIKKTVHSDSSETYNCLICNKKFRSTSENIKINLKNKDFLENNKIIKIDNNGNKILEFEPERNLIYEIDISTTSYNTKEVIIINPGMLREFNRLDRFKTLEESIKYKFEDLEEIHQLFNYDKEIIDSNYLLSFTIFCVYKIEDCKHCKFNGYWSNILEKESISIDIDNCKPNTYIMDAIYNESNCFSCESKLHFELRCNKWLRNKDGEWIFKEKDKKDEKDISYEFNSNSNITFYFLSLPRYLRFNINRIDIRDIKMFNCKKIDIREEISVNALYHSGFYELRYICVLKLLSYKNHINKLINVADDVPSRYVSYIKSIFDNEWYYYDICNSSHYKGNGKNSLIKVNINEVLSQINMSTVVSAVYARKDTTIIAREFEMKRKNDIKNKQNEKLKKRNNKLKGGKHAEELKELWTFRRNQKYDLWNIRNGPSFSNGIVNTIKQEDSFEVLSRKGDWLRIKYGNNENVTEGYTSIREILSTPITNAGPNYIETRVAKQYLFPYDKNSKINKSNGKILDEKRRKYSVKTNVYLEDYCQSLLRSCVDLPFLHNYKNSKLNIQYFRLWKSIKKINNINYKFFTDYDGKNNIIIECKEKKCAVCGKQTELYCKRCGMEYYCCREHQKKSWEKHKVYCDYIASALNFCNKDSDCAIDGCKCSYNYPQKNSINSLPYDNIVLPKNPPFRVYVSNLPLNCLEKDLPNFFFGAQEAGNIIDIKMGYENEKENINKNKIRNAYVTFKNIESMKYALTLSGKGFGENIIRVKIAIDKNYTINTIPCCDHIINVKNNKKILFSKLRNNFKFYKNKFISSKFYKRNFDSELIKMLKSKCIPYDDINYRYILDVNEESKIISLSEDNKKKSFSKNHVKRKERKSKISFFQNLVKRYFKYRFSVIIQKLVRRYLAIKLFKRKLIEKRNHDNDILIKRQRLINMEKQEIEEKESVLEYLRLKREKEYKNKIKEDEERENLRRLQNIRSKSWGSGNYKVAKPKRNKMTRNNNNNNNNNRLSIDKINNGKNKQNKVDDKKKSPKKKVSQVNGFSNRKRKSSNKKRIQETGFVHKKPITFKYIPNNSNFMKEMKSNNEKHDNIKYKLGHKNLDKNLYETYFCKKISEFGYFSYIDLHNMNKSKARKSIIEICKKRIDSCEYDFKGIYINVGRGSHGGNEVLREHFINIFKKWKENKEFPFRTNLEKVKKNKEINFELNEVFIRSGKYIFPEKSILYINILK